VEPNDYNQVYKSSFPLNRFVLSQMNSVILTFCVFKIGFVKGDDFPSTVRSPISVVDYSSACNSYTQMCHIPHSSDLQQFYGAKNTLWNVQTTANLSLPTAWRQTWEEKYSSAQSYPRRQMDVSGKYLVLAFITTGKKPRTLWVRAGWFPERVWTFSGGENSLGTTENRWPDGPALGLIVIPAPYRM